MNIYGEVGIGIAFATTGYASVLPDYLGMGDSPGLHPYHHARSQATACVDALRAARALSASNSLPLNGQIFLTGYSQGGHATMALHRELETYHTNEFTITASAPMAGAYDLSGVTTDDMLSGRPQPNPYYFAYLLAAYQEVYRLAPTFGELLQPPYDTTLPPLFDGNSSGSQINTAMPADPLDILKPELLADFRTNANHILRQALRDNDLFAWTPQRPMRLYHCAGDLDVIIANSQVAYASFQGRDATQVELLDPQPSADHGGCTTPSMLSAKAWFDSLKQ
jgi:pimeloyl-ACP methyl ester carboxylesterase